MTDRPLITFALFAYNQEQFIREAVEGAFAQTYSPLEIILSDDCSSDRTFEIMQEMAEAYQGPHTIILNRNEPNLGLCGHVNKVFGLATAEIVVVAAGDDISFPDRVANTWQEFYKNQDVLSVSMEYVNIDIRGDVKPNLNKFCGEGTFSLEDYIQGKKIPLHGATRAYKKIIFEVFGPLSHKCHAEDVALNFRCLLIGKSFHKATKGIFYRVQDNSLATKLNLSSDKSIYKQNIIDLKCAVEKGLLANNDVDTIISVMRNRLSRGIVKTGHKKSKIKLFYFFEKIIFSKLFSSEEKKIYFMLSLREILPLYIISKLNKFRAIVA